ncbi:hypothetical protein SDC9_84145 [bioreactor metagenome]|uniref:Uncharacterized protein n=1 Tax=bioreactor metagenome TaxID=1076179 RepID=A0A644ZA30_9ZZZZ
MVTVVGKTGDMRHRLPITQLWYCFWKQTITRFGFTIIFWNDFPYDDPGIDPCQLFIHLPKNFVQSFPGLHTGECDAGFTTLDVDPPILHIEVGFRQS